MIATLHAFACTLALLAAAAVPHAGEPTLLVETERGMVVVDADSGAARPASRSANLHARSPDGRRVAYIAHDGKADELFVAELSEHGSFRNPRGLTRGAIKPRDPQWTPDGAGIVYVRGAFDETQVYRYDLAAERPSETRISAGKHQSFMPRVAPDGSIAYLVLTDRKGKQSIIDLIVKTDGEQKTIVSGEHITALAWSPSGDRLAWSTHGKIAIHSIKTGENATIDFMKSIDEQLYAHHARAIAWRPDGAALAAVINFSGGRAAPMNAGPDYEWPPIFGDREIFIIPLGEGATPKRFTMESNPSGLAWRSE